MNWNFLRTMIVPAILYVLRITTNVVIFFYVSQILRNYTSAQNSQNPKPPRFGGILLTKFCFDKSKTLDDHEHLAETLENQGQILDNGVENVSENVDTRAENVDTGAEIVDTGAEIVDTGAEIVGTEPEIVDTEPEIVDIVENQGIFYDGHPINVIENYVDQMIEINLLEDIVGENLHEPPQEIPVDEDPDFGDDFVHIGHEPPQEIPVDEDPDFEDADPDFEDADPDFEDADPDFEDADSDFGDDFVHIGFQDVNFVFNPEMMPEVISHPVEPLEHALTNGFVEQPPEIIAEVDDGSETSDDVM